MMRVSKASIAWATETLFEYFNTSTRTSTSIQYEYSYKVQNINFFDFFICC